MRQVTKIAYRDLTRNRRRSLLTLVAVAVGISLLVIMSGLYEGALEQSIDNNIRLQTGHLQIRADSYEEEKVSLAWVDLLENAQDTAAQLQALDGVTAASPMLWASGIVSTREESVGVRVFGIDPLSGAHAAIREGMVTGEYLQPEDRSGLLMGQRLAGSLGLTAGDRVSLLVNTADEAPDEGTFTIRGLYATGVPTYDEITIFLPLSKAQAFTRTEGRASVILALLSDRELAEGLAAALDAPGYTVLTWRDMNRALMEAVQTGMVIIYVMYLVVLAVVAVVIANTLLMSVFERIREMGILAALGMKGREILLMFLVEAGLLGAAGVVVGVFLGSLGVLYLSKVGWHLGDTATLTDVSVAYGETIYFRFAPEETVAVAIAALVIILLASLYPAWFAARLEPIDALRSE